MNLTKLGKSPTEDKPVQDTKETKEDNDVGLDENAISQFFESKLKELESFDNKDEQETISDDEDQEILDLSNVDNEKINLEWFDQQRKMMSEFGIEFHSENDDPPSASDVDENEDAPDASTVELPDDDIWNTQSQIVTNTKMVKQVVTSSTTQQQKN